MRFSLSKHNTNTVSLKFTSDIKFAIDANHIIIVIFFDFSKTFLSVDHNLLVSKLSTFKMSSTVYWFKSYLSYILQREVDDNGDKLDWNILNCGVPQSATLTSMLLYLFFGPR